MDTLRQDLAYGLRALRSRPLLTAVIVLTLALGIGANTAIFTIVNAVLVQKLPYEEPERLTAIWLQQPSQPDVKMFATYRDLELLRETGQSFEALAGNTWAAAGRTVTWRGEPHAVTAVPSTENLFALLGVQAAQGRTFAADDLRNGCTAVLADRFWRNDLGAEPGIVGATLALDDDACTVVGVMPPTFEFFPRQTDVWTLAAPGGESKPLAILAIFGRLKPGVTREAAAAEAALVHQRVADELPPGNFARETTLGVFDLQGELTFLSGANLRAALLMLTAAVAMVLAICCVNVAGVLLGRGIERRKELALRAALGSGRARIVRQLLTESSLLAAAGVFAGAALAAGAVRWFRAVNPIDLPVGNSVTMSWTVLAFTAGAGVVAALAFGAVPALAASRVDLNEVLKSSGASAPRSRLGGLGGKLMVVTQLTVSMVLLAGAGLLIASIDRLTSAPLSFRVADVVTANVALPARAFLQTEQRSQLYDSLLARVAALPGVDAAALSSRTPLIGSEAGSAVSVRGRPGPTSELGNAQQEQVSSSYRAAMSIALLRGRDLDSSDRADARAVAIVNQAFVDEYLPGEEPLGREVKLGLETSEEPWLTIVGVAANVERFDFFNEMSLARPPVVYRPMAQQAPRSMTLLVRTRSSLADVGAALEREIRATDARIPAPRFESMDQVFSTAFAQPRFRTQLLGGFAGLALVLAAVGVYGLLMRAVARRTREIGIRMALGADRGRVLRSVLRQGMTLAAIGIAAGLAASAYLARFLASMLYGVDALDAPTLAATAAVLAAATLVAAWVPARRATRVDPLAALKEE
ncbi:MAG TPA: ABC transporter permease [Gammaproteobacteria bacterium]|nr:ABC transporter permease [Gammaproteobacteria bacterium]